mgnify:FL=1
MSLNDLLMISTIGWYSVGVSYWSVIIVRLIDFTILALHVTIMMYFLIDHTHVDDGQFN